MLKPANRHDSIVVEWEVNHHHKLTQPRREHNVGSGSGCSPDSGPVHSQSIR